MWENWQLWITEIVTKTSKYDDIDDVIEPSETRTKLARALEMLIDKEELRPARKHGNIPL